LLNGQWKTYTLRGTLVNFQTFKGDSLNGISRDYWIDGKTVMSEREFFNGNNKFLAREFGKNGRLESEIPYEDGTVRETKTYVDGEARNNQDK